MEFKLWNDTTEEEAIKLLTDAREKLSPIPEDEWCENVFTNGRQCCAIGHLQRLASNDPENRSRSVCSDHVGSTRNPIRNIVTAVNRVNIAEANNFPVDDFDQETPKQRTLAFIDAALAYFTA